MRHYAGGYVFGVFGHGADTDHEFSVSVAVAAIDLFREQVRTALESWAAHETDLEVVGMSQIEAPGEIDVNTPATLTVRHSLRNNGPATITDTHLTTTSSGPDDCTITPLQANQQMLGLALGEIHVVDVAVVVGCADPSFRLLACEAAIAPLKPLVADPVTANDAAATSATIALIALAGLAILVWEPATLEAAGLGDFLVGQSFVFDTLKTLRNGSDTFKGLCDVPVDATVLAIVRIATAATPSGPCRLHSDRPGSRTSSPASVQRPLWSRR